MNDRLAILFIGASIGVLMVMLAVTLYPNSYKNVMTRVLEDCEKSLPRDQHCVIVALPISKD